MPNRGVIVQHIDAMLADDPRLALIAMRELTQHDVPWLERQVILFARREGFGWARMGRLLNVSRQSLWERYKAIDGTWEPLDLQPVPYGTKWALKYQRMLAEKENERAFEQWAGGEAVPW
jgi:hypothetical protein